MGSPSAGPRRTSGTCASTWLMPPTDTPMPVPHWAWAGAKSRSWGCRWCQNSRWHWRTGRCGRWGPQGHGCRSSPHPFPGSWSRWSGCSDGLRRRLPGWKESGPACKAGSMRPWEGLERWSHRAQSKTKQIKRLTQQSHYIAPLSVKVSMVNLNQKAAEKRKQISIVW